MEWINAEFHPLLSLLSLPFARVCMVPALFRPYLAMLPSSLPGKALLLPTTPTLPFDPTTLSSLTLAAESLRQGKLVAFPTETVYGLGASALDSAAVAGIFRAKGRPSDNPLIVHVSSPEMLWKLLPGGRAGVPAIYLPLMARFWPGPLSLIFPLGAEGDKAENKVASEVLAGASTLAVRMPSHPIALELIRLSDVPLAAPSANLSSRPSPTTAHHVVTDLGTDRGVAAIIDGGESNVGVESTVVDWVAGPARGGLGQVRVLRAGGVSAEEIAQCLNDAVPSGVTEAVQVYNKDFQSNELEARPTTPGMKYKHYSPTHAKVILVRPSAAASNPSLFNLIQSLLTTAEAGQSGEIGSVGIMLTSETLAKYSSTLVQSVTSTCDIISLSSQSSSTCHVDSIPARPLHVYSYSLGSATRPQEAAQRLFAGLRYFDSLSDGMAADSAKRGVAIILLECIEEAGVGLAVMERSRKAAGGTPEMLFTI